MRIECENIRKTKENLKTLGNFLFLNNRYNRDFQREENNIEIKEKTSTISEIYRMFLK